nr:MAG TPA: hypothetical protein [Caudoviricetes sp.]
MFRNIKSVDFYNILPYILQLTPQYRNSNYLPIPLSSFWFFLLWP